VRPAEKSGTAAIFSPTTRGWINQKGEYFLVLK
jgi:hypothetical protein